MSHGHFVGQHVPHAAGRRGVEPGLARQEGLLLRNGHDDLGLTRQLQQDFVESHDGGDDRRLDGVLGLVGTETGDTAFEPRVDGLRPAAIRTGLVDQSRGGLPAARNH